MRVLFCCFFLLTFGATATTATTLLVFDNVYRDPYGVRASALTLDYNVTGNFPGWRTATPPHLSLEVERLIQGAMGDDVTVYPATAYHGAFQYTLKDHQSWVHADRTAWGGVLYLSPNPPPHSGTRFYVHKATALSERPTELDARRWGFPSAAALLQHVHRDAANMSAWQLTDQVANRFNRLVLFRGYQWHRSAHYFGSDLQSARLFQTFFFDTRP